MPSIEVGFDHRSEPPTFPDAVYDEIADALIAEVESGGSSGIVADKRYVIEVPKEAAEVDRESPGTPRSDVGRREKR